MDFSSAFLENKKLNEAEFKEGKTILQSKPLYLNNLVLTNICNIKCIMCTQVGQKKFTIPYEHIKQIIELFPYLESIRWQGGEVFLVGYFKELLTEALKYPNIIHEIQTNGLLLDERWVEFLVRYNVNLSFSIDGADKKTYEYIRQGGDFEILLKNIDLVNKFKEKYNSQTTNSLCVCVMKSNYRQLEEFVEFAVEYNFHNVILGMKHGHLVPEEDIFSSPDGQVILYLRKTLPNIEKKCKEHNIGLDCRFKSLAKRYETNVFKEEYENSKQMFKCKFPWMGFHIDAETLGEVRPNCLCRIAAGNITQQRILDIWNSHLIQQYRKEIHEYNCQNLCSSCNSDKMPVGYLV